MSDKSCFLASYADWRLIKTRKLVQICFELPIEKADEAYQALGGMPQIGEDRWFAIARLDPAAMEVPKPPPEIPRKQQTPQAGAKNRYAQRAGIICGDPMFQKYLADVHGIIPSTDERISREVAAEFVRQKCGVESRADILPNTLAATTFNLLETDYICWRDADKFVEVDA